MGLDMYLNKRTYVKRWDHQDPKEKFRVIVHKGGKKYDAIKPERVSYLEEEVLYWRKANAIHAWFVENVQDGDDDCKQYEVTREQLQELYDTCKKVLDASVLVSGKVYAGSTYKDGKEVKMYDDGKTIKNPTVAQELLPTQSGFFFGDTEYDQYYYEDIKYTKEELEKLLAENDDSAHYKYQSSW